MNEERIKKILLVVGLLFTALFCLAPFFYMVLIALIGRPDFLGAAPAPFTLGHFRTVLTAGSVHFLASLRNSVIVSATSSAVAVFLASLGAYALVRLPLPRKDSLLLFILSTSMFPAISLISYLYEAMAGFGWINTYQALILPYVAWTLPLSVWMLVSYFTQVPEELDQAGLVDGCSRLQILTRIVYPVAAPGLFSTGLLAFIFAFSEFLFALMLTTDHATRTVPVTLALFEGLHGEIPWGEIMAAAALTTIPVILLALFFQRKIIQGLTHGAVKE